MDTNSRYPHSPTPIMTSTTKDQASLPNNNKKLTPHTGVANITFLENDSISTKPVKTKPKSHKSFTQLEALVVLNYCTEIE